MNVASLTEDRFEEFVALINALADYEHLPRPDAAAIERLRRDAFGPHPRFEAALALSTPGPEREKAAMDRSDEPSAFAWIMSGTVGAVVAAGLGKFLLDRRRHRAVLDARDAAEAEDLAEVDGHPS